MYLGSETNNNDQHSTSNYSSKSPVIAPRNLALNNGCRGWWCRGEWWNYNNNLTMSTSANNYQTSTSSRRSTNANRDATSSPAQLSSPLSPRLPVAPTTPSRSQASSRSKYRPTSTSTSVAMDDRFDAVTTEVPTEWGNITGETNSPNAKKDYEESITGYQNYVNEMERMLGGEVDLQVTSIRGSSDQHVGSPNVGRRLIPKQSHESGSRLGHTRGASGGGGGGGSMMSHSSSRRNLGAYASMENIRQVSGRKASIELVEHKIMEDGPSRTISLWRERVAQSGVEREDEIQPDFTGSHVHRHKPSGSTNSPKRMVDEFGRARGYSMSSLNGNRSREAPINGNGDYQRSEYMVSYKHARKGSGGSKAMYPPSELGYGSRQDGHGRTSNMASPRVQAMTNHNRSLSPQVRRSSGRSDYERSEYMITFPNTPPHSQGSSSGRQGHMVIHDNPSSPIPTRTYIPIDAADGGSMARSTGSSVETRHI
ncbi:hypothetical protein C8Q75DRAFT_772619 [Abortiporus biennis]|nr:hypothetical protein C8Q75DRAFT_772619 [Abortiporus biennis]